MSVVLGAKSAAEVIKEEAKHIKATRDALKEIPEHVPRDFDGNMALCLSGGGIRSGSFSMGVLQAFAEKKLLREFDYISAVSGGGYALGWWSALVLRMKCQDTTGSAPKIAIEKLRAWISRMVSK